MLSNSHGRSGTAEAVDFFLLSNEAYSARAIVGASATAATAPMSTPTPTPTTAGKKRRRTRSHNSASPSPSGSPGRGFYVPGFDLDSGGKAMSLRDVMDVTKGLTNMYLAHEIAVDKDFMLQDLKRPENPLEEQVKEIVHK